MLSWGWNEIPEQWTMESGIFAPKEKFPMNGILVPWSVVRPSLHLDRTSPLFDPSVNPGVGIAGAPDIVALGIESIGGTSTCSGELGFRQLV